LLTPFAMCAAFPPSDYYGVSAPPGPVSRRCACPAAALAARARAEPDGSHVHCRSIDERGVQLCPCGLATVTPQTFTVASLPTTQASSGVTKTRSRALMCAASTPYPPDLRWGLRLRGFMTLVPLLRLLVSLTRPGPSGSTRPSWLRRGCFPPSPAPPGSGCPQLQPAAATTGRRRSLTSTRSRWGRSGAPCRCYHRWVSPNRLPNPACTA